MSPGTLGDADGLWRAEAAQATVASVQRCDELGVDKSETYDKDLSRGTHWFQNGQGIDGQNVR